MCTDILLCIRCLMYVLLIDCTIRKRTSIEPFRKTKNTWSPQPYIYVKLCRWYPPYIPKHPSVSISTETRKNKACQAIHIQPNALIEICAEHTGIILTPRQYKQGMWLEKLK